jgi:hypothetical protein
MYCDVAKKTVVFGALLKAALDVLLQDYIIVAAVK